MIEDKELLDATKEFEDDELKQSDPGFWGRACSRLLTKLKAQESLGEALQKRVDVYDQKISYWIGHMQDPTREGLMRLSEKVAEIKLPETKR